MTEEELKAIEERLAKATKGPWEYDDGITDIGPAAFSNRGKMSKVETVLIYPGKTPNFDHILIADLDIDEDFKRRDANGRFIAHARTDVPALLAEVRRLREADRWIPVGEKMPEECVDVLFGAAGWKCKGWYMKSGDWFSDDEIVHKPITHWRPIKSDTPPPAEAAAPGEKGGGT